MNFKNAALFILIAASLAFPLNLEGARRDKTVRASRSNPAAAARAELNEGRLGEALLSFRRAADRRNDPALRCEYAFVLAKLGMGDAALAQLDQAMKAKRFPGTGAWFRARILRAAGADLAADELGEGVEAPDWLKKKELEPFAKPGGEDLNTRFINANRLAAQDQPHLAAAEFAAALKERPQDPLGWIGLSLALEKLGALKSARKALERAAPLSEKIPALKKLVEIRKTQLGDGSEERRSRRKKQVATAAARQSRVLLFGGGSFGSAAGSGMTGRVGYFVTPTLDAAVDLGLSGLGQSSGSAGSQQQLNLGVSSRYYWPVGEKAGAAALGVRLGFMPKPADMTSLTVSPGFTSPYGDIFLDVSVNSGGFQIGITVGATQYFGGGK